MGGFVSIFILFLIICLRVFILRKNLDDNNKKEYRKFCWGKGILICLSTQLILFALVSNIMDDLDDNIMAMIGFSILYLVPIIICYVKIYSLIKKR